MTFQQLKVLIRINLNLSFRNKSFTTPALLQIITKLRSQHLDYQQKKEAISNFSSISI
jgi:hypothetical protein